MTDEEKIKWAKSLWSSLGGNGQVNICIGNQQNNLYSCNGDISFDNRGNENSGSSVANESMETSEGEESDDANLYPDLKIDGELFNDALIINKLKLGLAVLVGDKQRNNELKIAHWFIVWKVFHRYNIIPKQQTQAKFIEWVKAVYGWNWSTLNFKGSVVPEGVRDTPLEDWTIENLSSQKNQGKEYFEWKERLEETFLEDGNNGRKNCKSEFCTRWFDTNM